MNPLHIEKAVILGATGPTGRHLAKALQARDLTLRVVSRSRENLDRCFGEAVSDKVAADLLQAKVTRAAIEDCDVVFDCIGLPGDQMPNHAVTARNIAATIGHTGARCVQISSFWAYLPAVSLPLTETHPRIGGSEWVQQRRAAEDILQQAGAAIVNLPDFYGPQVHTSVLQQALMEAARGKAMNWIGAADTPHEYVFVPDAMATVATLATYEQAYGQRWIAPGAGTLTGRQVAAIVGRILGKPVKLRPAGKTLLWLVSLFNKELRGFMPMVPEYLKPITYDGAKLEGLIGTQPTTGYEEGIRRTLEWLSAEEK